MSHVRFLHQHVERLGELMVSEVDRGIRSGFMLSRILLELHHPDLNVAIGALKPRFDLGELLVILRLE
jgi:hypothetical protein